MIRLCLNNILEWEEISMVWLEMMFIVWSEESWVDGSLFLIYYVKVSMTCSSMIGWRDKVGGDGMSYGKAQAIGIVMVNEVGVEKT